MGKQVEHQLFPLPRRLSKTVDTMRQAVVAVGVGKQVEHQLFPHPRRLSKTVDTMRRAVVAAGAEGKQVEH